MYVIFNEVAYIYESEVSISKNMQLQKSHHIILQIDMFI